MQMGYLIGSYLLCKKALYYPLTSLKFSINFRLNYPKFNRKLQISARKYFQSSRHDLDPSEEVSELSYSSTGKRSTILS